MEISHDRGYYRSQDILVTIRNGTIDREANRQLLAKKGPTTYGRITSSDGSGHAREHHDWGIDSEVVVKGQLRRVKIRSRDNAFGARGFSSFFCALAGPGSPFKLAQNL